MFSNTRMLRSVLVKAVLVACVAVANAALADGSGNPPKPGGGYVEPTFIYADYLNGIEGGTAYPIEMTSF